MQRQAKRLTEKENGWTLESSALSERIQSERLNESLEQEDVVKVIKRFRKAGLCRDCASQCWQYSHQDEKLCNGCGKERKRKRRPKTAATIRDNDAIARDKALRNAFGNIRLSIDYSRPVKRRHQGVQATAELVDDTAQATPDTEEQSLQVEAPTAESATLTTVSATTGTEPADAQTQISRVKVISTEADTQHFNSCHELKDAATDPSNAHVELQTAFSLNAFAQENDKIWRQFLHRYHETAATTQVTLRPDSAEYQSIKKEFIHSLTTNQVFSRIGKPLEIRNIKRLEHMYLYIRYENKKAWMAANKDHGRVIERWLWHGTAKDSVSGINRNGFNKVLLAKNATAYGEGTYLAVDANYSHWYAKATNDGTGDRHMYYCRCLTGDFKASRGGTKMAPQKKGSLVTYDTTVDYENDSKRRMFIVYDPDQVYPQYLITYRDGKYN